MTKPRARELGIPFSGTPGQHNAITDVPGVEVGEHTLIEGRDIRTGVTAILPAGRAQALTNLPAAIYSLNGNGELTGAHWVEESGFLGSPVMITNTHSVGAVHEGVCQWLVEQDAEAAKRFMLPVVAETFDGTLNDINGFHVRPEYAMLALEAARTGPVQEGNVGGGTGMITHQFKGGNGTSSRIVAIGKTTYTLGCFVQSNYGLRHDLTIAGLPVGRELADLMPEIAEKPKSEGSIIAVIATDAPLLPHHLKRIARRVAMGLALIGGKAYNGSGDIFIAFSTARPAGAGSVQTWQALAIEDQNVLFSATIEATEEAIINALVAAETMTGYRGNTVHALPHDRLQEILRRHGRLAI